MLERSFVQMPTRKTFTATLVLVAAVCWLAPTAIGQAIGQITDYVVPRLAAGLT